MILIPEDLRDVTAFFRYPVSHLPVRSDYFPCRVYSIVQHVSFRVIVAIPFENIKADENKLNPKRHFLQADSEDSDQTIHFCNENFGKFSKCFTKMRKIYSRRDTWLSNTEKNIDPNLCQQELRKNS